MSNDRLILSEHDTFSALTDCLQRASSLSAQMGQFRPDQRNAWNKLSEVFKVNAMAVWKLAEEAATKGIIK